MTEEQAKNKWCPMVRYATASNNVENIMKVNRSADQINCIGTACMMWRWDNIANPNYNPHMGMQMWPIVPATIQSETDGHCGLAHG